MVKKKKNIKTEKNIKAVNKKNTKTVRKKQTNRKNNIKHEIYWDYFSLVMFLVFSTLFISMIIVEIFFVLGRSALWLTIPVTAILWGLSYLLARVIFNRK
ncbi:MAG TPA: hypothetical protein P5530_03525 [Candidatus Diapherotrites archaeon]|jgi:hypothetical protein|nr:hypothetical protein [Candidatus Diapherotrites archaeon]